MLLGQSAMTLHVEHRITSIDTLYHKEQPGERGRGEMERERGRVRRRVGERDGEGGRVKVVFMTTEGGWECAVTCCQSGSWSEAPRGTGDCTPAQTNASQSEPNLCPIGEGCGQTRPPSHRASYLLIHDQFFLDDLHGIDPLI